MKKSLYLRLLRYQSSDTRSNLENFLTEAFCDLLNRMSEDNQIQFLSKLLNISDSSEHGLKRLRWESQVSIPTEHGIKYPDLVGYDKNKPVILIECKISANFTHTQIGADDSPQLVSQLEVYGQWLKETNPEGHLVLLSHATPPPHDFLIAESSNRYGVERRYSISWQNVYDQLRQQPQLELISDFQRFLTEQGLAMDNPTRQDFAVFEFYYAGAAKRVQNMLKASWEQMKKNYSADFHWTKEATYHGQGWGFFNFDDNIMAVWGYSKDSNNYIEWGIHFPDTEKDLPQFLEVFGKISKNPFIYCLLTARSVEEAKHVQPHLPEKWRRNEILGNDESLEFHSAAINTYNLSDLLEQDNLTEAFTQWVNERISEALQAMKTAS